MLKIKDKVFLGCISAVLATTTLNVIDLISVLLRVNKWHIWQIAASLYFKPDALNTLPALLIGAFTHTSIMSLAGVIICYLLYYSGKDYYLLKGFGVLMIFWIFLFGFTLRMGLARIKPVDAGTNIAHFIGHAAAGLLISYLIIRLADETIWANKIKQY